MNTRGIILSLLIIAGMSLSSCRDQVGLDGPNYTKLELIFEGLDFTTDKNGNSPYFAQAPADGVKFTMSTTGKILDTLPHFNDFRVNGEVQKGDLSVFEYPTLPDTIQVRSGEWGNVTAVKVAGDEIHYKYEFSLSPNDTGSTRDFKITYLMMYKYANIQIVQQSL